MNRSTKILLWSLLALAVLGIGLTVTLRNSSTPEPGISQYHCPMHPTYVSDEPGDCPICGMRLVPIEPAQGRDTAPAPSATDHQQAVPDSMVTSWTCPMHPDVHSDKAGACPTCGMDLVPQPGKPAVSPTSEPEWECPMHPEVTSTGPGKCPTCGMKLTPIVKTGAALGREGDRRLLYYRNPMDPRVTSPTPAKDSMGMDYVAVYSDDVGSTGDVSGLATVAISGEGMRQAGVQVTAVRRGSLGRGISTVGLVRADEGRVRQISLKVGGWVEELLVRETGQIIREGQPLLTLYSPELLQAQEEYSQALVGAHRMRGSAAEGDSDALVAAARRRLELLDTPRDLIAELESGGPARREVLFRAPSPGVVTVKSVIQGQRVEAGMDLFTVTNLDRVWVDASLYESESSRVAVNQTAVITLPSDPGNPVSARVQQVLPTLDPATRTVTARFSLDNPGAAMKPGMYVDIVLETAARTGLVIPASAILDTGVRQIVYVESDPGTFTPRQVTVGLRDGDLALVLSGLQQDERVASRGTFLLDSEARIRGALAESRNR